jgi:parallel beta-helix repeat protein
VILGNYIGTDWTGKRKIPNQHQEISISEGTRHNFVGGATTAERNVISGNETGVKIENAGIEYNVVAGNLIGVAADGGALGNDNAHGVWLEDYSAHNFVQGNVIAHSGRGVHVTRSLYSTIRRNSIYSNVGPGIVLADGGNQMLPPPIIISVTTTGISGLACPGCTVEVFSDIEEEGRVYEGSAKADASGVFVLDNPSGFTGPCLTATATDRDGNTSEFSTPQRAKRSPAGPRRRRRSQGEGR